MKRVAIDVGGTFTDCLVMDESGRVLEFKAASTPQDYTLGFLESLRKAAEFYRLPLDRFLDQVKVIIHGTTVATNIIITREGAKTGMITTKGFRDIFELRSGIRLPSPYNLFVPPHKPLVPRHLRIAVTERVLHNGDAFTPLSEEDVVQALDTLERADVEAVAICYLHSYANPAHEQRTSDLGRKHLPHRHFVTSHEVLPVWREYERFSTAVLSAYVGPAVERYLAALEQALKRFGFRGQLLLVVNSGLVQMAEKCRRQAVHLVGSGPTASPSAAVFVGRQTSYPNIISIDMGGTSTDIAVIRNLQIPRTSENWVGDERLALSMVNVPSFGGGGGSIAWIDSLGVVRVGPQSAGAEPGPACYGKGGKAPAVTDANVVLGYVPADYFLGGQMPLHEELARDAIATLGKSIGLGVQETAKAIFGVVNAMIAGNITTLCTKRGLDVRDFVLLAAGGSGGVHGAGIARELDIATVVVPRHAAAYSAFGMFAMQIGWEFARSYVTRSGELGIDRLKELYREMEEEARSTLRWLNVKGDDVIFLRSAEMRYVGQYHEVETPLPSGDIDEATLNQCLEAFHRKHDEMYAFSMPERPVEFLTFRLRASVNQPPVKLVADKTSRRLARGPKRRRACLFDGRMVDTPIYDGKFFEGGDSVRGPAVIEEPNTTVVIPPDFEARADSIGNYVITRCR